MAASTMNTLEPNRERSPLGPIICSMARIPVAYIKWERIPLIRPLIRPQKMENPSTHATGKLFSHWRSLDSPSSRP
jgi:hypothetical protein